MSASPFGAVGSQLNALGYSVIPIQPGTKYPGRWNGMGWGALAWKEFETRLASYAEVQEWMRWPNAGIGIALGKVSGVVALDFDNDVYGLHAKVQALITNPSPVKKVGSKGYTAFYRYNGEPGRKWKIRVADGTLETVVELLSSGNQTVIPPTIHPGTRQPYYWIDGQGLENYRADQLPELPEDFLDNVSRIFDPEFDAHPQLGEYRGMDEHGFDRPATMDEVASALEFVSSDCPHDDWVHIGMAIKREFGEAGFSLWENWSRKGTKYPKKHEASTKTKWKSFKRPEGRTIGTVFYMAQQAGWVPPYHGGELPTINILPGGNLTKGWQGENRTSHVLYQPFGQSPGVSQFGADVRIQSPLQPRPMVGTLPARIKHDTPMPDYLVHGAPGIIGDIARWATACSVRPQPVLSLACAVGAAGTLFAHRVQTETRLRTNMLVISLAPSGSGKDQPQKCISELFQSVGLGDNIGGSNVTSGNSVVKHLYEAKGRGLFIFDEFGRSLKNMVGAKASTFQLEIVTTIMQLYSNANTVFRGKEFSGRSKDAPRMDIDQPCLCVVGSTVPQHFYQALTSTAAVDGFLSRWLIFETFTRRPPRSDGADIVPPPELVAACQRINDMPTTPKTGNLVGTSVVDIQPRTIPFSNDARTIMNAFSDYCDEQGDAEYAKKTGLDALWTRGAENAAKLALCGHEGDMIEASVAQWAVDLVKYMMHRNIDFLRTSLSDNETEAEVNKVLNIIREKDEWVSKTEITRRTQWLRGQRREEILRTLINETGDLIAREVTSTSGRKSHEFKYNKG